MEDVQNVDIKQFPKHNHVFRNGTNHTDYKCANITQQGDGKVVITLTPDRKGCRGKMNQTKKHSLHRMLVIYGLAFLIWLIASAVVKAEGGNIAKSKRQMRPVIALYGTAGLGARP